MSGYDPEHEVELLKEEIKRLGEEQEDGSWTVTFKTLFDDDKIANLFEALVGTLKAAKKRKVISYEAELLLQGMSDNEVITLNAE